MQRFNSPSSVFAAVGAMLVALAAPKSLAAKPVSGESNRGLPALIRVGVPAPNTASVVAAGGLSYGRMPETRALDASNQYRGTAGLAFTPLPYLSLGLDMIGLMDRYPAAETNLYGEPRLTARFSRQVQSDLYWGGELDFRILGAEAPSVKLSATSPSLRGLLAKQVTDRTWLAAQLGFHLDRSAEAIPDPARLSKRDKQTIGASSWNALQWGFGGNYYLANDKTELLAELAGELLVGAGSPPANQSPYRLSVGARHPLNRDFSVMATAGLELSKRPLVIAGRDLHPAQPRTNLGLTLIWHLDSKPKPAPRPVEPPPPTRVKASPKAPIVSKAPPPLITSPVTGTVVDEGGRPLADVEITIKDPAGQAAVSRTFADGAFTFPAIIEGPVELVVKTPGFDEVSVTLEAADERTREIVLRPAVPAGQVRGNVKDLQGEPIAATITIQPGAAVVLSQSDGSFEIELAPGRYTIKLDHEDFAPQWRKIRVHNRGVVILNIALIR